MKTLYIVVEDTGEEQVEKDWCQDTAVLHTIGALERIRLIAVWEDLSCHANLEEHDDLDELLWAAVPCQYRPEGLSVDCIKGIGKLNEYGVQIQVLLYVFLLDLSH